MIMDLSLIIPPYNFPGIDQDLMELDENNIIAIEAITEPTTILSLVAQCRRAGLETGFHDLNIAVGMQDQSENIAYLYYRNFLRKKRPSVVAIEGNAITYINHTFQLAMTARNILGNDVLIVTGGENATSEPEHYFSTRLFDTIIIKEADNTLPELTRKYREFIGSNGNRYDFRNVMKEIRGLAIPNELPSAYAFPEETRSDGNYTLTNPRPPLTEEELSNLPFPERGLYPMEELMKINGRTIGLYASRGCPYSCRFCNSPTFWDASQRRVSPESVIREIRYLADHYNARNIMIYDVLFAGWDQRWLKEYIRLKRENNIDVKLGILMRADRLTRSYCKLLEAANVKYMFVGVESFSQDVLNDSQKRQKAADVEHHLANARAAEVQIEPSAVIGFPEDTENSIKKTTGLMEKLCINGTVEYPHVFHFIPFPGTMYGKNPEEIGIRIVNRDYQHWHFTPTEPICSTKHLSAKQLYAIFRETYERFREVYIKQRYKNRTNQ
jgi:radical SAM superfamily enzyme YgiQ (UPF0313 family)